MAAPPGHVGFPSFSLAELLREALPDETLPRIRVVDVGAMLLDEAPEIYEPLLKAGLCDVVGFEPNEDECQKLNDTASTRAAAGGDGTVVRFLPYALGDGSEGEFRRCSAPMTSSMLEPNIPLLRRFAQLEEVTTVVRRTPVKTRRLDDLLTEIGGVVDFLKLDVQGYELAVLEGADAVLKDLLVLHTEVEFVEMYEKQPLFAEVDRHLRARGFVFHRFASVHGRPVKPLYFQANPLCPISQQMWADAVYVRDLWNLEGFSRAQHLRAAMILHEVYRSFDVVHHVLTRVDSAVAQRYLEKVLGGGGAGNGALPREAGPTQESCGGRSGAEDGVAVDGNGDAAPPPAA